MKVENSIINSDMFHFIIKKEKEYGLEISLIDEEDAEFICDIRNTYKARLLNKSITDIKQQIQWIHEYKLREKEELEFYFIFWIGNKRVGTIRFIKMDENTFESGSWLFVDNIPFSVTVKAELFCKDFAFEYYAFKNCYFYMNKKNRQVIRFHNMFHPDLIKEEKDQVHFLLNRETYYENKNRILSYCQ